MGVVGFGVAVAGTVLPGDAATDLVGRLARGRVIDAPLTLARWLAAATQTAHASGRRLERVRDEWNRRVAGWHRAARRLTPRECARLMGFPDSFVIPVSDTRAYKQFGNSVVVPAIREVARIMQPYLTGESGGQQPLLVSIDGGRR
jgi:site-specific DNA-cytosine methylase